MPNRGGWLLVGFIVVLGSVFVAMATISLLLVEHRRSISHTLNHTRAVYLAQAGLMQALYDFRSGNGIRLGLRSDYTVDAGSLLGQSDDDVFIIGHETLPSPQADFFLLNWKSPISFPESKYCPSSGPGAVLRDRITGWIMRNVLASGQMSLVITAVQVDWPSPAAGESVIRIDFNGTGSDWTAPGCQPPSCTAASCVGVPSGTPIDLTAVSPADRTIGPGVRWGTNPNQIWFRTATMDAKAWLNVTMTLSDGSIRRTHYEPTVANRSADFTIRSRGEVRKGAFPFPVWRRLQAEYRVCSGVTDPKDCNDADEESALRSGALRSYQELTQQTP